MRIVINRNGVRQLLTGPEITRDLTSRANRIAAAAGSGHRVEVTSGSRRARAAVITDDIGAMRREAVSRNLTRAIDAGR